MRKKTDIKYHISYIIGQLIKQKEKETKTAPTRHMHHPAVAVLHDVAGLTLDAAGRHAVDREEAPVLGLGHTLAPRRRQVRQLPTHSRKQDRDKEDARQYRANTEIKMQSTNLWKTVLVLRAESSSKLGRKVKVHLL